MSLIVSLIAAVSADGFISRGHGVPWHLPADKAHFRGYTAGKWLLLGRKTFEEMIGWFRPDQHPLVMTTDAQYQPEAGQRVSSLAEALALAESAQQSELVVVGGSSVFNPAMPHAGKLVITHVHEILGAGVPFPPISTHEWEPVSREAHPMDAEHPQSFEIVVYQRVMRLEEAA